jgi:hypothetical protein
MRKRRVFGTGVYEKAFINSKKLGTHAGPIFVDYRLKSCMVFKKRKIMSTGRKQWNKAGPFMTLPCSLKI